MNNENSRAYPEVIGHKVDSLLARLDDHINDPMFREDLHHMLKQLTDVKLALDESSIVAVTDHRGTIQYVNDKFCEISQYTRDELLGKDHRIINSGFHSKMFIQSLWQTITSGQVWRGEIKNRAKDGSNYWVNTTIVPFLDNEGIPYQYLAIRNEVTQLKKVEEELQQMMSRVMHIQETERQRFSRELHDGIGQGLFGLVIQLDQLIGEQIHQAQLASIRQSVTTIIEEVRSLAWDLRPSVLDDLGIVPALRTYIDNFKQHYGIQVQFTCGLKKRLDPRIETALYRIVQEALTNVGKYASVTEASVDVWESEAHVYTCVTDHGNGFVRNLNQQGVGLFSMEERARGIGGQLDVVSILGEGTTLTLKAPKGL
jgi:two-component system sensor histidine kinase NreB